MKTGKIMGLIVVTIFAMLAVVSMPGIFGAADEGVDLTGTDYEDQYDAGTDVAIATTSIMQFVPYIMIFVCVIVAVGAVARAI